MIKNVFYTALACMAVAFAPVAKAQLAIEVDPAAKTWSLNGTAFNSKSKYTDVLSAFGGANRTIEAPNRTQHVFDSLGVVVEVSESGTAVRVFLGQSIRATEPQKRFTGTIKIAGAAITAANNLGEVKAKTPAVTWTDLMGKSLMFQAKGFMMMVDTRSGKVNDIGFGYKN
jgi:hypothetical protein